MIIAGKGRREIVFRPLRSGFTLLETVVVIGITGLLMALLVPAVQSARESARRTDCKNRLRNIGQALLNYESVKHEFPPAFMQSGIDPDLLLPFTRHHYAPHVHLLPYLDQGAIFQRIDLRRPQQAVRDPSRLDPELGKPLSPFICPSDPVAGGNNYRLCTGSGPGPLLSLRRPGAGAFIGIGGRKAADFVRGLSNVVFGSEKLKSDGDLDAFSDADYFCAGIPGSWLPLSADDMVNICRHQAPAVNPLFCSFVGHTWFSTGYNYTLYNHVITPNAAVYDCSESDVPVGGSSIGSHKASSCHRGGVNTLYGDGHVEFVSNSVDLELWRRLAEAD